MKSRTDRIATFKDFVLRYVSSQRNEVSYLRFNRSRTATLAHAELCLFGAVCRWYNGSISPMIAYSH